MVDVDYLSRRHGVLLAQHTLISCILSRCDKDHRPEAYTYDIRTIPNAKQIAPKAGSSPIVIPILTISAINNLANIFKHSDESLPILEVTSTLSSVPIHLHTMQE